MSKYQEERFPFGCDVCTLKQFLLKKMQRLTEDVETLVIPPKNVSTAKAFTKLLQLLLKSDYFKGDMLNQRVYKLMERLKEDDVKFVKKIEELEAKISDMERRLEEREAFVGSEEFTIPDEREIQQEAISRKRKEIIWKIEAERDELNTYKYRLELCRKLKGIICRPKGFFSAAYKID